MRLTQPEPGQPAAAPHEEGGHRQHRNNGAPRYRLEQRQQTDADHVKLRTTEYRLTIQIEALKWVKPGDFRGQLSGRTEASWLDRLEKIFQTSYLGYERRF